MIRLSGPRALNRTTQSRMARERVPRSSGRHGPQHRSRATPPGAAFRIGLARETRRGRTAAEDERAASLEETASASPAGGNVVAFRTGPQADVGASERAGADVTAHPEIGKKRHERPLENEAGAVGDEPDDEALARIVGAADGQAIPPRRSPAPPTSLTSSAREGGATVPALAARHARRVRGHTPLP